ALVQKGGLGAAPAAGGAAGATTGARGGAGAAPSGRGGAPAFTAPLLRGDGEFALVLYPSPALHDGRGATQSWLQERPDPVTRATWGSWVELHTSVAKKLGVETGEL